MSLGCLPEKSRVYFVSDRHYDDSWRNAPDLFRKASETFFLISELYRALSTSHGNCRSALYPCYVKEIQTLIINWQIYFNYSMSQIQTQFKMLQKEWKNRHGWLISYSKRVNWLIRVYNVCQNWHKVAA